MTRRTDGQLSGFAATGGPAAYMLNLSDTTLDTATAFRAAGLDWEVEKRPVFTYDKPLAKHGRDADDIIVPDDAKLVRVPGRYAMWRLDNGTVLGDVGEEYQPIVNVRMFNFFDELRDTIRWAGAGMFGGGETVWGLVHFPDSDIVIGKDDKVAMYGFAHTRHDGGGSMIVDAITNRFACYNMLRALMGDRSSSYRVSIRHSGDVTHKLAVAQSLYADLTGAFANFERVANELDDVKATKAKVNEIIDALFPEPEPDKEGNVSKAAQTNRDNAVLLLTQAIQQEVLLLPEPNPTMWTVLNGFTRYVDHASRVQVRGRDAMEARAESVTLGRGDKRKQEAAEVILGIAGVKA